MFVQFGQQALSASFAGNVTRQQHASLVDPEVHGSRWVSKTSFPPPPENDALNVLLASIADLGDGTQRFPIPSSVAVPVQWVGYRRGVHKKEREPLHMNEQQKFDAMTAEASADFVIMYLYGGSHVINGPATRRSAATTLSRLTGARCCIVQHRLAPQCPFPYQQLDVLSAYLSLLYPPPGSFHQPVDPRKLIIAGDSSGAQLGLSLTLTILSTHRRAHAHATTTLRFHGRDVLLRLPAGLAFQSPAPDQWGRSLPTWDSNRGADLFVDDNPSIQPDFPFDSAWPASPPRVHYYTETPTLLHSLVSPVLAGAIGDDDGGGGGGDGGSDPNTSPWTGAPPIYLAIGGAERLLDGARVVAQTAARARVPVLWDEYELMPHNWAMFLRGWPQSGRCFEAWARACVVFAAAAKGSAHSSIVTRGSVFAFDPPRPGESRDHKVDVMKLTTLGTREVLERTKGGLARFERDAAGVMAMWRGSSKL